VVTIDRPLFTIGRRSAADLQIVSTDVSREHAEVARDGDRYLLRDRGSRYGTFVNGEQVTECPLSHGDRVRLGRTDAVELVFFSGEGTTWGDTSSEVSDLRQMTAILNGLRALGSGRVVDEVLTLVIDSALDVTKADRGFVMLANAQGELEFKTARGRGHITLPGTSFTTSAKIPRDVFTSGHSTIVADLLDGNLAGLHDGTIAVGIRHVLCVPLQVAHFALAPSLEASVGQVIGVLYLDGRERGSLVSQTTLASLEAFATQAALAIESARLYAESAEKARTDRDLRVAAEIQRALLPEPTYVGPYCDLAAVSVPCRTVGGDFFDYLSLNDGRFGFALGDVAGKGPPAALLAATVQSHFVAQAPVTSNPGDTMARINAALLRRAVEARFATMFYGALAADGLLSYSNAGQEPPLVVHAAARTGWLEAGGPVLGLLAAAEYESGTVQLQPGDLVVVFSDGVSEASNPGGAEFGRQGLLQAMRGCHGAKSDEALETVLTAVRRYSEGTPQGDDITALVLRYRGAAS
jgi:serine phosphatase RsbU (regulator of sigma subunit)/pSer/pThr/pTyr-binding forkhead associated (FHA) protein